MIRTQIYLTEEERTALQALAKLRGKPKSDLIRQAIDLFIERHDRSHRIEMLRAARGIWADRPEEELQVIRAEMDRFLEPEESL